MDKTCARCGKEFTAHRTTKRFCSKQCQHATWILEHTDHWEAYNKQWRLDHPDYWNEYYQDGRGVDVEKRRHVKHPMERKARSAISNALRLGKISKPDKCQMCGESANLEAHHWHGYDPEHWLDVQWLCKADHIKADNNE